MRMLLFIVIVSLLTSISVAAETITVEVTDISAQKGGNIVVFVFGDRGFPIKHEKALAVQTEAVTGERMLFTFQAPANSELAFKVLHDEDNNNKVTKNWTGIWPREGLGFSNDQKMGSFGPPNFEKAKLSRDQALKGVGLRVTYP